MRERIPLIELRVDAVLELARVVDVAVQALVHEDDPLLLRDPLIAVRVHLEHGSPQRINVAGRAAHPAVLGDAVGLPLLDEAGFVLVEGVLEDPLEQEAHVGVDIGGSHDLVDLEGTARACSVPKLP